MIPSIPLKFDIYRAFVDGTRAPFIATVNASNAFCTGDSRNPEIFHKFFCKVCASLERSSRLRQLFEFQQLKIA